MLGEFDLIGRYLAPLAAGAPGALGLADDAGLLDPPSGQELVLTADAMIAGGHFLPDDPPDLIARKLLRVNLSDLAAMGAGTLGYLMTVAWPQPLEEAWVARFAAGLSEDQDSFGITLLGGDTTRTPGPLTLSLTAIGSVPRGQALKRSGAQPGDLVFVSGTLGDAALGLKVRRGEGLGLSNSDAAILARRYQLPEPRISLGQALAAGRLAHAAIDVSDGLVADIGHLLAASKLSGEVEAPSVPLSEAAKAALSADPSLLDLVLTGGDDYELLFTVAAERAGEVAEVADRLDLSITCIGSLAAGAGLVVRDDSGNVLPLGHGGWTHF